MAAPRGAKPNPGLRRLALLKLDEERSSAEGATAFAILVARARRLNVARACVAFEILYDYLDALGETHPTLDDNRRLHTALIAAVGSDRPVDGCCRPHRCSDDGGYIHALVATCRAQLGSLPRTAAATAPLLTIAMRAVEAQSRNHATLTGDDGLHAWADREVAAQPDLRWFEFAAGAGSPLGIYALFAAARTRRPALMTPARSPAPISRGSQPCIG